MVLNIGSDNDEDGQAAMHDDGVEEVLPEVLVWRIGDGGIHVLLSTRPRGDGLGDYADVIDARHAKRVDHGSKTAKRNGFVAAKVESVVGVIILSADFGQV